MSPRVLLVPAILALGGCGTIGGNQPSSSAPSSVSDTSAPSVHTEPRLVIPVTGGPPVLAIPLGGDSYLPVAGGPPVLAMPVSP